MPERLCHPTCCSITPATAAVGYPQHHPLHRLHTDKAQGAAVLRVPQALRAEAVVAEAVAARHRFIRRQDLRHAADAAGGGLPWAADAATDGLSSRCTPDAGAGRGREDGQAGQVGAQGALEGAHVEQRQQEEQQLAAMGRASAGRVLRVCTLSEESDLITSHPTTNCGPGGFQAEQHTCRAIHPPRGAHLSSLHTSCLFRYSKLIERAAEGWRYTSRARSSRSSTLLQATGWAGKCGDRGQG